LLLLSGNGGTALEEVVQRRPEALLTVPLDPLLDPTVAVHDGAMHAVTRIAETSGQGAGLREALLDLATQVYRLYRDRDATLVELSPLALVDDDASGGQGRRVAGRHSGPSLRHTDGAPLRLLALDVKVSIDGNALFRQRDLAAWRSDEDDRERRARNAQVSYVTLDGDIGVIGSGAGLAMSTVDAIAAAGGRAANFCDIGGGARAEQIAAALHVVATDPRVRVLLINVFAGIADGLEVARGLVAGLGRLDAARAAAEAALPIAQAHLAGREVADGAGEMARPPIVVRLDGSNATSGRRLLLTERPEVATVETPLEAVERVVALARKSLVDTLPPVLSADA
jgi:succinyl-CoA synthetase beta subunit